MKRPRLYIDLDVEQLNDINRLIPWGYRNAIFRALVDKIIDIIEEDPTMIYTIIVGKIVIERREE